MQHFVSWGWCLVLWQFPTMGGWLPPPTPHRPTASQRPRVVQIPAPPFMAVRPLACYLISLNSFPPLQMGVPVLKHAIDVGQMLFIHQIIPEHIAWARHCFRYWILQGTKQRRPFQRGRKTINKQEMHSTSIGERRGRIGGGQGMPLGKATLEGRPVGKAGVSHEAI